MNATLSEINAAVDAAFNAALALPNPARVAASSLGDNATLRTDTYTGPRGAGFVVMAVVNLGWRTLTIARQHGPETNRERPAPTLAALVAECQEMRAAAYAKAGNACSVYDIADAETKLASSDPAVQAEGAAQKAAVLAQRLQIKAEIPKPE